MKYGHSWSTICSPSLDDSEVYLDVVNFDVRVECLLYLDDRPDLNNGEDVLWLQRHLLRELGRHVKEAEELLTLMDNNLWQLEYEPMIFDHFPHAGNLGYSYPEYAFQMQCVFKNKIDFRLRNAGAMVGLNMFSFLYSLGRVLVDNIVANRPFLVAMEKHISGTWPGRALALPELYVSPSARRAGR